MADRWPGQRGDAERSRPDPRVKKLRPLPAAAAAVEKEGEEVGDDKNIDGKRL